MKKLKTDDGKDKNCHKQFADFLQQNGIIHETTVPHTPEQNGVSERVNRTLIEKTKCLLQASGLIEHLWGEAITDLSPTAALQNMTPEEVNLRIFLSKAYFHIPKQL